MTSLRVIDITGTPSRILSRRTCARLGRPMVTLRCRSVSHRHSGRYRYLSGDLLRLACEGERQEAGLWCQARSHRELEFFKARATAAAAEIAYVQAAKVVCGEDRHGVSLVLAVRAVGPPAGRGLKVQVPRVGPRHEGIEADGRAVNRWQCSVDVDVQLLSVSAVGGVKYAEPAAGKAGWLPPP